MDDLTVGTFIGLIISGLFGTCCYFLPTLIAIFRGHPNALPIFVLNLVPIGVGICTGFVLTLVVASMFVFWVAALVWSVVSIQPAEVRVRGVVRTETVPTYPDDKSPFDTRPQLPRRFSLDVEGDTKTDVAVSDWLAKHRN